MAPTDPFPGNREGERQAPRKGECGLGAAAAAAASFVVWAFPDLVAALDEVLWLLERPRFLMWRGNLRRKRAVWASFTVAGCRAVRLSHMTEGLVLPHIG